MSKRRVQLTAELQEIICEYIRRGADPFTAAEAAGVPQAVFERWLRYGQARRPVRLWQDFYRALRTAAARAVCEAQRRRFIAEYNELLLRVPAKQREGNVTLALMEAAIRGEPAVNCVEGAVNRDGMTTDHNENTTEDERSATAGEGRTTGVW
jgi:hypothetical protein